MTVPTEPRPALTLNVCDDFARLPASFFSRVTPTPLQGPHRLVSVSAAAARLIDLDADGLSPDDWIALITGTRLPSNARPLAMVYAGHQFGHLVPQLGDGRAILLAQVRNQAGALWDLHLKGAGPTPYSRQGDGRAVLRSSIREYLCSEAMAALGIPTTRALGLVASSEAVYRERIEPGATVLRLAPSHIRFGHFEYFYYGNRHEYLAPLADYLIDHHLTHLREFDEPYLALLDHTIQRTAETIAAWQSVGFCHGVMNTDNMAMLGHTLDYGPFGFLDTYDAGHICNHSDHRGRYAYDQQPYIGHWNLSCLAQAMLPILDPDPETAAVKATGYLETYPSRYDAAYLARMRAKLGLAVHGRDDRTLVDALFAAMQGNSVDFAILFRTLADFEPDGANASLRNQFLNPATFDAWAAQYATRLKAERSDPSQRRVAMHAANPKYVLRNHLAEIAIQKSEAGDDSEVNRLLAILARPYDEQPEHHAYADYPPAWATGLEVSCSS
ncbi:MAG: YdiU family protein [Gammaproteobacteria bacterium]|nr:YdiU family protein [Gammaproteobacteria bacterium]MCP5136448.1 YdiU family protein [Gammaproteobacteria bacterium]